MQVIYKMISLFLVLNVMASCSSGGDDTDDLANQEIVIDNSYLPVTTGSWYQPGVSTSWQWQLLGTVNTSYNVDVYDIDLFDATDTDISELHGQGKKVICYFSAGSWENWRSDKDSFNAADLGNTLDGWVDEKWLDIRSANVRSVMQARLDYAVSRGCDGVEPDNMDGYDNNPGFNLTAQDQLDYNRFVANEARSRGLAVGLKNDIAQIGALVEYYDFAVNEQCFQYNECGAYHLFTDNGKPVFNAEYPAENASLNNADSRTSLCAQAVAANIQTLILPLDLDDSFRYSCN